MHAGCMSAPLPPHVNTAVLTRDGGDLDSESTCAFLNIANGLKSTFSILETVSLLSPVPEVKWTLYGVYLKEGKYFACTRKTLFEPKLKQREWCSAPRPNCRGDHGMFRHFKSLILLPRLLIRLKHITGASKAGAIKHFRSPFCGEGTALATP